MNVVEVVVLLLLTAPNERHFPHASQLHVRQPYMRVPLLCVDLHTSHENPYLGVLKAFNVWFLGHFVRYADVAEGVVLGEGDFADGRQA